MLASNTCKRIVAERLPSSMPYYRLGFNVLARYGRGAPRQHGVHQRVVCLWRGSLLEERKLLIRHGDSYARYRARVNGLIPWPGRILSEREARVLVDDSSRQT